jgi:hypothetical protein
MMFAGLGLPGKWRAVGRKLLSPNSEFLFWRALTVG